MISWQEEITNEIEKASKVAVLGAGSILCGDDAAGMIVAEKLHQLAEDNPNLLALAGSTAPENFVGVLRSFAPDLLIFVDAAHIAGDSGEIAIIDPNNIAGLNFSTHMLPFGVVLNYIRSEINCEIKILGIKPGNMDFGTEASLAIYESAEQVVRTILDNVKKN